MRRVMGVLAVLVTALVTGLAVGPAAGAATPASTRRARTRVVYDCQRPYYEPSVIIVACGDGTMVLRHASYSRWSNHSAAGWGVLYVNSCTPDCADGSWLRVPVQFKLERPVRVGHHPVFSRLITYSKVDGSPRRQVYSLETTP